MEGNLAPVLCDEPRTELVDGKLVAMSPGGTAYHNWAILNLSSIFERYLHGKPCLPFGDGMNLYLTHKDHFIPDFMVVCDKNKIKGGAHHVEGAPDFVVEVLSPGTSRRDKGHKKRVYERCGVREYWIVSPMERFIEQYVLENGAFVLRDVYYYYPPYEMEDMTEEEKSEAVTEFRPAIFDDLSIRLEDVFYRVSD